MHLVDTGRTELILPRELAHKDLMANPIVTKVLSHPTVLGPRMVVHSLGAALAEPGAKGQNWHRDQGYLLGGDSLFYNGLAGQDLPPHVFNAFVPLVPNMTHEHGPTEFCMGSSWLDGVPYWEEGYYKDLSLLEAIEDYVELGENGCPPRFWRSPIPRFGDMVIFDYQLLHRGGRNLSPDMRAVVYATYSRDWYKDGNFKSKSRELVNLNSFESDQQEAANEQMIETTRFALPESMECGNSMLECLSGEPPVILEKMDKFLSDHRIAGEPEIELGPDEVLVVSFTIGNVDLDSVSIYDKTNQDSLVQTLDEGHYAFFESTAGTILEARTPDGHVLKSWKVAEDQDQVLVSKSHSNSLQNEL